MFRALSNSVLVADRQLYPDDMEAVVAAGIELVVNNRPDGEEAGQPSSAEIERAALAAGLRYRHIPVAGAITADQVAGMAAAMDEGKLLAFCRTGTRSALLWAAAARRRGVDAESIVSKAAAAGYDLTALRPYLA
jgi:uncharacterized protein (TIGR01244 family)